jgi:hypothetical protein
LSKMEEHGANSVEKAMGYFCPLQFTLLGFQ